MGDFHFTYFFAHKKLIGMTPLMSLHSRDPLNS